MKVSQSLWFFFVCFGLFMESSLVLGKGRKTEKKTVSTISNSNESFPHWMEDLSGLFEFDKNTSEDNPEFRAFEESLKVIAPENVLPPELAKHVRLCQQIRDLWVNKEKKFNAESKKKDAFDPGYFFQSCGIQSKRAVVQPFKRQAGINSIVLIPTSQSSLAKMPSSGSRLMVECDNITTVHLSLTPQSPQKQAQILKNGLNTYLAPAVRSITKSMQFHGRAGGIMASANLDSVLEARRTVTKHVFTAGSDGGLVMAGQIPKQYQSPRCEGRGLSMGQVKDYGEEAECEIEVEKPKYEKPKFVDKYSTRYRDVLNAKQQYIAMLQEYKQKCEDKDIPENYEEAKAYSKQCWTIEGNMSNFFHRTVAPSFTQMNGEELAALDHDVAKNISSKNPYYHQYELNALEKDLNNSEAYEPYLQNDAKRKFVEGMRNAFAACQADLCECSEGILPNELLNHRTVLYEFGSSVAGAQSIADSIEAFIESRNNGQLENKCYGEDF